MKFKDKETMKDAIETQGLATISKLTAINWLGKMGMDVDGLIATKTMIDELECNMWSIIPLAMSEHNERYEEQLTHIQENFSRFISAVKLMKLIGKE